MISKISNRIFHICLGITTLIAVSCDSNRHSESYKSISENGWHKDTVVCISSEEITELNESYNIILMMRHTTEFKYKNMYFFVDITTPTGETFRDTTQVILQDAQGYWYGEGSGFLREVQEHEINGQYKRNTKLPAKGVYKFCISQGMRDEVLENISDVGIRIEYVN